METPLSLCFTCNVSLTFAYLYFIFCLPTSHPFTLSAAINLSISDLAYLGTFNLLLLFLSLSDSLLQSIFEASNEATHGRFTFERNPQHTSKDIMPISLYKMYKLWHLLIITSTARIRIRVLVVFCSEEFGQNKLVKKFLTISIPTYNELQNRSRQAQLVSKIPWFTIFHFCQSRFNLISQIIFNKRSTTNILLTVMVLRAFGFPQSAKQLGSRDSITFQKDFHYMQEHYSQCKVPVCLIKATIQLEVGSICSFSQLSTFLVTLIAFKNFVEMKFIFAEAFIHNFVTFIA